MVQYSIVQYSTETETNCANTHIIHIHHFVWEIHRCNCENSQRPHGGEITCSMDARRKILLLLFRGDDRLCTRCTPLHDTNSQVDHKLTRPYELKPDTIIDGTIRTFSLAKFSFLFTPVATFSGAATMRVVIALFEVMRVAGDACRT